jgi:hypothetical protein
MVIPHATHPDVCHVYIFLGKQEGHAPTEIELKKLQNAKKKYKNRLEGKKGDQRSSRHKKRSEKREEQLQAGSKLRKTGNPLIRLRGVTSFGSHK